jgi:hypothetical protein
MELILIIIAIWLYVEYKKIDNQEIRKKKFLEINENAFTFDNDNPNRPINWNQRKLYVKIRDEYKCSICGSSLNLQVHHIIPIKDGGSHAKENLTTLCLECHSGQEGHSENLKKLHALNVLKKQRFKKTLSRKEHTCDICGKTIGKNEYYYSKTKSTGEKFYSEKLCSECAYETYQ